MINVLFMLLASNMAFAGTIVRTLNGQELVSVNKLVTIRGEITKSAALKFVKDVSIASAKNTNKILLIEIDSSGGFTDQGNEMISMIETSRPHMLVVCVAKKAQSMAFNLYSHCDLRLALPKANLMFHAVRQDVSDGKKTAAMLRTIADDLEKTDRPYRTLNASLLGLSLEDYDLLADNETDWKSEALKERGYIQDIVTIENSIDNSITTP